MANYYSHTMLRRVPQGFRLTDDEQSLLRIMGFTVQTGSSDAPDYVFSDIGADELTIARLHEESDDPKTLIDLAVKILCTINLEACESGGDDYPFDYANLFQHALMARSCTGFIQLITVQICDKARIDGFGGGALHITADAILHMTTDQWLTEQATA